MFLFLIPFVCIDEWKEAQVNRNEIQELISRRNVRNSPDVFPLPETVSKPVQVWVGTFQPCRRWSVGAYGRNSNSGRPSAQKATSLFASVLHHLKTDFAGTIL
jgi:hypothetical protein